MTSFGAAYQFRRARRIGQGAVRRESLEPMLARTRNLGKRFQMYGWTRCGRKWVPGFRKSCHGDTRVYIDFFQARQSSFVAAAMLRAAEDSQVGSTRLRY